MGARELAIDEVPGGWQARSWVGVCLHRAAVCQAVRPDLGERWLQRARAVVELVGEEAGGQCSEIGGMTNVQIPMSNE